MTHPAVHTTHLTYKFPHTDRVGLADINLDLAWGSTTLLVGPNGAGKLTLLKILAGKTLVAEGSVSVNGLDPFRATSGSEARVITTYLGTEWAANPVVRRDMPVVVLLALVGGDEYPERRQQLVELLDIDLTWRMHQVSDGERRRVQLAMGLLQPWRLLLLDEVTVDLDVLVRHLLLEWLHGECRQRDAAVVYATHIFDGLGNWADRVVHLAGGCVVDNLLRSDILYTASDAKRLCLDREQNTVEISPVQSLHPLALEWLKEDIHLRGVDRSQGEKNRPLWEELLARQSKVYYDSPSRVTDYFRRTRTTQ